MLEIFQVCVQANPISFTYFLLIIANCHTELLIKLILEEFILILFYSSDKTKNFYSYNIQHLSIYYAIPKIYLAS